ncbi:phage tail protein [Aureimonas altamirensis]|uniref:phage tail protein n=1 Tax=Aureimonas altamirensis TaxID=370622 RepID=UPI00203731F1|nr:phage tail protein [Aureimonas altamirensis]MCM2504091.1 phage tail protein [Aureimonas altamirensis]
MANFSQSTGTKVYVAGESSASTLAEFETLTWTEIGGITSIGSFGDEREEITVDMFGAGRRIKRPGVRDAGTLELEVARDALDVGQQLLRDGFNGGRTHAVRVVLDDRPAGGGTPTSVYCLGVILSARIGIDGPNDIVKQTFNVSLTDAPLEVPAEAA